MNERIVAVTLSQTGNATAGDWTIEFPFPTRLLGLKHSGTGTSKTSTIAVSGGATVTATTIGNGGDPTWTEPDSTPDYADADTAYVFTIASGTAIDDPLIVAFFLVGDGGSNIAAPGERICCVTLMQTGNATAGDWVVEFPFPTRLIGLKHSGTGTSKTSTIAVAGGATVTAATIGNGADPTWTQPDSTPDYAAADTAYTFSIASGTAIDDPLILAFFACGEGGSNYDGVGERTIVTTLMQTGNATTADWVVEFPWPVRYLGSKTSGSNANTTTLAVAGGAVDAAAQIGDSGDPNWLEPTTSPDYVAPDTACTFTLTQSASVADDPCVVSVWAVGEG